MIVLGLTVGLFLASALSLHVLHHRIARALPDENMPTGRVLLEITPATLLARKLTRGVIDHPLAGFYRMLWYAHMASGLAFAIALLISPFVTLP